MTAALPAEANVTLPGLNERLGFSSFRDHPDSTPYAEESNNCGESHEQDGVCAEELYTIFPDGTQETRITANGREDTKFSWFPQIGGIFSFESRVGCEDYDEKEFEGCHEDIFSATDPGPTRLTNSGHPDTTPSQSPDGSMIAFESGRVIEEQQNGAETQGPPPPEPGTFQQRAIYTMSSAGEGVGGAAVRLTPLPEGPDEFFNAGAVQADLTPAWSPDGTQIAFTRLFLGQRIDILDTSTAERAAAEDWLHKVAARVVAGEVQQSDVPELLGNGPSQIIAIGLSIQTYIAPSGGGEPEPLLDPESNLCIFGQALPPNGTGTDVTECNFDRHPAWTPDGSRILVDRMPGIAFLDVIGALRSGTVGFGATERDIVSISVSNPADVVNLSNATEDAGCDEFFETEGEPPPCDEDAKPAPSPDGTRVAFHSDRACAFDDEDRNDSFNALLNFPSRCFDIWTMNMDGTDPQRVTTSDHADWHADWRRTEAAPVVTAAPPPAAPRTPARPLARIAGLRRACTASARMRVRIRATAEAGVRSVRVSLDGRRIKTSRKSRFTVFINARKLRPGRHRISVTVTDRAGQRRTTTRRFSRCAARRRAAPRFTG